MAVARHYAVGSLARSGRTVLLRLPRSARLAISDDHPESALTAPDCLFAAKLSMLLRGLCDIPTRYVGTAWERVSAPARANQRMGDGVRDNQLNLWFAGRSGEI